MQWQMLVKNLINKIDIEACIANSFKDYHAKGIDYLNLLRTPHLTVKVYNIDSKVETLNKHHLTTLNPHTHRYNSTIIHLKGNLEVKKFKYLERAIPNDEPKLYNQGFSIHNRFDYKSPLILEEAQSATYFKDSGHLVTKESFTLKNMGDSVYLEADEITSFHSSGDTMFVVFQYSSKADVWTNLFTQAAVPPVLTDLYRTPTKPEVYAMVNIVDELVSNVVTSPADPLVLV